ncbi:MAG: UvrB/UvrC motif-containing protein [Verrucomicrobiales bacterium]
MVPAQQLRLAAARIWASAATNFCLAKAGASDTVSLTMKRERPDLKAKLHEVPHKPGIYLMKDRLNRVIYVGKARDLRKRLSSYFMPSRRLRADLKTRALIDSIWDFEVHLVRNESEALLLEGKLIKEYRPKYNVSFRDDKRFLLVRVHPDDPWPRFQLTRLKKEDGARYFGPFAHSGALRTTISWLNREFGLRACRPALPGESDYKHCSNDIIKNCAAPCIGKVTRAEYLARVKQACSFLEGQSKDMIAKLEEEMEKAARRLDFEKAADLRDMLADLKTTLKPKRKFNRGRGVPSTVKPLEDLAELGEELGLPGPPQIMECFDISNISTTHCVASMVRFRDGAPDNQNYRRYRIKTVRGQNDFASMAEVDHRPLRPHPARRPRARRRGRRRPRKAERGDPALSARLIEDREREEMGRSARFVRLPDLVIVDGGKTAFRRDQATPAARALRPADHRLGKGQEEIFRPAASRSLPRHRRAPAPPAHIRDGAHRFAGHHQLLK